MCLGTRITYLNISNDGFTGLFSLEQPFLNTLIRQKVIVLGVDELQSDLSQTSQRAWRVRLPTVIAFIKLFAADEAFAMAVRTCGFSYAWRE